MAGAIKMAGPLSITAMTLLALVLFAMVSRQPEIPTKERQTAPPVEQPKPASPVVMAVTLPPPPAPIPAPATKKKQTAFMAPPHMAKTAPPKPAPALSAPKEKEPPAKDRGRVLLRLLEVGEGPAIEIAWPADADQRVRLYRTFTNCLGMKIALLDSHDRLYISDSVPGQAWRPNFDKFSAFMRQPSGALSHEENRKIAEIRSRHGIASGTPVRLFPRRVDAVLLAGLKRLVVTDYRANSKIDARYELTNKGVKVIEIRVNGQEKAGEIILPRDRGCRA